MNKNNSKKINHRKGFLIVEKEIGLEEELRETFIYLMVGDNYLLHKNRIYKPANAKLSSLGCCSETIDAWTVQTPAAYASLPKSLPCVLEGGNYVGYFEMVEEGGDYVVFNNRSLSMSELTKKV